MKNEELIRRFRIERKKFDRSGIYAYTQRTLAYNSNKIEGSTLNEEQTASLFDTGMLPVSGDYYRAKDVEETNGHFLMFNKMIDTLDEPLSEELIKAFHFELKSGVFEDRANGYAIGDYKKRPNMVGMYETALPKEVPEKMRELLARIRAVLRRSEMRSRAEKADPTGAADYANTLPSRTILRFGPWRVDMGARHLIDESDVTVSLSALEFKLLEMFLRNPQRVLTRESILLKLENRSDAYDRNIDVQMSRLRAKLRDSGRSPKLIRTMRGDGYMLAVPVEREVP